MKKIHLLLFIIIATVSTVVAQENSIVKGNLKKIIPILAENMDNGFTKLIKPIKDSTEKLIVVLENESNIASIEVKWNERFGKKNRQIIITWKKNNLTAFVIQQQQEIIDLVSKNFKSYEVELTENRLVSYVKKNEVIAGYDATFSNKINGRCYVQSIIHSDYSNRTKPVFNNQLSFYTCN